MLKSGDRLGPYEVVSPLGAGGMGEVYKARDTRLDRPVAVKVLPESFAADAERMRRFEQEARATGALNHPNVMSVYDVGSLEGRGYMVTELLEGQTLRERLGDGALPVRKAVELATQIARGLAAAHDKGIVHRDLKPENLFVTRDGHLKILDFGLAKVQTPTSAAEKTVTTPPAELTGEGMVLGTAGYMSPEQVRGQPADARSDIFALGCVVYEMLSGRRAFLRETSAETMTAILRHDPAELTGGGGAPLSPGLATIVRRCLEKEPAERFQSARDLAFALEAATGLSGFSTAARAAAGARLRPRVALAAAAGAAALALVVVGALVGRGTVRPASPTFEQMTFRRGTITDARFTPDGQNVVYSAAWDGGPLELYSARVGSPESRALGLGEVRLLSVRRDGDLALSLRPYIARPMVLAGTLATVPMNGGAPRESLEAVESADFGPDPSRPAVVRAQGGVSRLEYPPGTVLFETNGWIESVRVAPSGNRVAFLHHPTNGDGGGEVMVAEVGSKARPLSRGYLNVSGVAWAPSGREIWFTGTRSGNSQALWAVTSEGRERLVLRVPGYVQLHDISAQGRVLFGRETLRSGMVATDPATGKERDVSWFDWGTPRAVSSDGRLLLFDETGEGAGARYGVFVRGTDGSPAVRLGDGVAFDLSPDGRWVIAGTLGDVPQLAVFPTAAGEARALTHDALEHAYAQWLPDGKGFIFFGGEPGRPHRLYVQAVGGGAPRPITPEGGGSMSLKVSPDGNAVAYEWGTRGVAISRLSGGEPLLVPGTARGERPVVFTRDGSSLIVRHLEQYNTCVVERVSVVTGARSPVRVIRGPDPAGLMNIAPVQMTPDERFYAYAYVRDLTDLFVADGLR